MLIGHPHHLGPYLRGRRHDLEMTQDQVASAAGVSRRWLLSLEAGKESVRLDLILRVFDALGLVLDVRPDQPTEDSVDLDAILSEYGKRGVTGRHTRIVLAAEEFARRKNEERARGQSR